MVDVMCTYTIVKGCHFTKVTNFCIFIIIRKCSNMTNIEHSIVLLLINSFVNCCVIIMYSKEYNFTRIAICPLPIQIIGCKFYL